MRGQQLFFATREDLQPGLERIESGLALEYVRHQMRDDPRFERLTSLLHEPGVGDSRTGHWTSDDVYFVYEQDARPIAVSVPQRRGGVKFCVEWSPHIVQIAPAGVHRPTGALVAGRIAPLDDPSPRGLALYQAFTAAVLGGFTRVHRYAVGPRAYAPFRAGRRLATIGIRSPRDYDLREDAVWGPRSGPGACDDASAYELGKTGRSASTGHLDRLSCPGFVDPAASKHEACVKRARRQDCGRRLVALAGREPGWAPVVGRPIVS